jgi:hypothetical protein
MCIRNNNDKSERYWSLSIKTSKAPTINLREINKSTVSAIKKRYHKKVSDFSAIFIVV